MSATPLTCPPRRFTAGDTVIFNVSLPQFPPNLWTLDYVLSRNGNNILTKRATTSGALFLVTLAGSDTSITPGNIDSTLVLTEISSSNRRSFRPEVVFVSPNPTGTRTPSVAENQLAAANAAMQRLCAGGEYQTVNFSGQEFTMMNLKSLQDIIDRLQAKVDFELRELGVSTRGGAKTIQMGFR